MKRFVLLPGAVAFFVVLVSMLSVIHYAQAKAEKPPLLVVTDQLTPGNEAPAKKLCADPQNGTMYELCKMGNVNLDVSEGKIIHAFVTTRKSPLTIGDVMTSWGPPVGANYFKYSISVYWPDRYAYVLRPFDPSSQVVFLFYSHELTLHGNWRGYRSSPLR